MSVSVPITSQNSDYLPPPVIEEDSSMHSDELDMQQRTLHSDNPTFQQTFPDNSTFPCLNYQGVSNEAIHRLFQQNMQTYTNSSSENLQAPYINNTTLSSCHNHVNSSTNESQPVQLPQNTTHVCSSNSTIQAEANNVKNNIQNKSDSRKREGESISHSKGKRLASNISNSSIPSIPLSNKYAPLSSLQEPQDDPQTINIPPIIVSNVYNFTNFLTDLQHIVKNDFATKTIKNNVKIIFQTIDDFRNYKKFCDTNSIQYFSYRDPTIKTFNVIFKGVPICYTNEIIFNELTRLNYPVQKYIVYIINNVKPIENLFN